MFQRRVFGRKPVSGVPAYQPQYEPLPQERGRLSYDMLAERVSLSLVGKEIHSYTWTQALLVRLAELTRAERGEVFLSLLPYAAEIDSNPSRDEPDQDAERKRRCFTECCSKAYDIAPEDLRDYIALIAGVRRYMRHEYAAQDFITRVKGAIAAGAFLTSNECTLLAAYAQELRTEPTSLRGSKRACAEMAAVIDKIAGVEISTASILLDRCEDAETGEALGDLPENYDFWCALLAAAARAMNDLRDDLRGKKPPVWMTDRAAFDAAFPPVGPFVPRFGQWEAKEGEPVRDFAFLRNLKRNEALVEPERYLALRDKRDVVAPMIRYGWNTPAIPGLERLGDLESPAVTELLELFVTTKSGPRPTAAWTKNALKLAAAVGIDEVQARLHDWLAFFHTPVATPETLADATNCHRMDRFVGELNALHPDWPALITADNLDQFGRALALNLATGNPQGLRHLWSVNLFQFADAYKGRSTTTGELSLPSIGSREWYVTRTQPVSMENEQLLRAAVWLLPSLPDKVAAANTLEKTALAAACRMGGGSDAIRSKTTANAAIAALVELDSDVARLALLRLSTQIEDRTINAPILAALNG